MNIINKKLIFMTICLLSTIIMTGCNKKEGYSITNNSINNIKNNGFIHFNKLFNIDVTDISIFDKTNNFKYFTCFDDKDNIYIADSFKSKIYKFDKNGLLIKSFGRPGQGPEEFYRISTILVDGDMLRIFEFGGTIKNVSLDGRYISSNRIFIQNRLGVKKIKNNYFIMAGETDKEFRKLKIKIYTTDKNMLKLNNIIEYDHKPGLRSTYEFNFFDWLLITDRSELYYPENNLEKYSINKYNNKGEILKKINREYQINRYSKDAENRFKSMYKKEIENKLIEFPKNPPVITDIFQDSNDNIWVLVGETYEDNRNKEFDNLIDIFDDNGELIYSFKSKILSKNCIYNNGKIYRISPMDENVLKQYIDVYEIEYKR